MKSLLEALQPLGRALMLPIAVLPVAGLMLRLGQADLLDSPFLAAAGDAIFAHLGLLFAIGVATGFARDGDGAACLGGVVCFLVATEAGKALLAVPPEAAAGLAGPGADLAVAAWKAKAMAKLDVPIGILSGLIGGVFYNRFSGLKLPSYLAFFGGRRFVPIAAGVAGLVLAAAVGLGNAGISAGIATMSDSISQSGSVGLFLYGMFNRLFLVTGLHHVLNNFFFFVQGDYQGVSGDLRRFFAGDPTAGGYMTGFFPVMMFGLPAACLAMYHAARPERRRAVAGLLFSLALTSALTGVTEPIEFTFMFLAPALYVIHAVLTGVSMAVMDLLNVKLGFGFSAGLFDYVLSFGKATRPLLLIPVGLVYFAVYYGLFRLVIERFDLPTPGREKDEPTAPTQDSALTDRGAAFISALGGAANITKVDACATRLRLIVAHQDAVDAAALKALGALGIVRPSDHALQVVLGPVADIVAVEIRDALARPTAAAGDQAATAPVSAPASPLDAPVLSAGLVTALGGIENILSTTRHHGRVRVVVAQPGLIDDQALATAGPRGACRPSPTIVHLLG
ncbi:MAG: N-acetylglucosamine-specific PTS transporter subunit IIBC [Brevundimonas sp.]